MKTKDNNLLKKDIIAKNILQYRKKLNLSQEKYGEIFGVNGTIIYNIEKKKTYPKLILLCRISDYEEIEIDFLISEKRYTIHPHIKYMELVRGIDENTCIKVLLRAICERYKMYGLYNESRISSLNNLDYIYDIKSIGYMIRFFREIKGISLDKMSSELNYIKETLENAENGSNALSILSVHRIGEYLDIPMDVLLIGNKKNKKYSIDYLIHFLFFNITDNEEKYIVDFINVIKSRI